MPDFRRGAGGGQIFLSRKRRPRPKPSGAASGWREDVVVAAAHEHRDGSIVAPVRALLADLLELGGVPRAIHTEDDVLLIDHTSISIFAVHNEYLTRFPWDLPQPLGTTGCYLPTESKEE